MTTNINIKANSACVLLQAQGLLGVPTPKLTFKSPDSPFEVTIPAEFMPIDPGDTALVTISFVVATPTPDQPPSTPGLILPGGIQ